MTGYRLEPGSHGPRRDFRITVGLREGWDAGGHAHGLDEAVAAARDWMTRRAAAGQPFLSGMFSPGAVAYAWTDADGAHAGEEPVAIFSGEALHAHLGHLSDAEITALLDELATLLGTALGQEHMHVAYRDEAWTLVREGG